MSATETSLSEDKYLFTFQDETQLWISKEFIEKYQQFPFYDIIEHSEKYDDGSYYIDMLPFHMEKVIQFLMEDNVDIESLDLKDSYDIYETLVEYSITINNIIQSDLLFHVKELFIEYLKKRLFTPQRKDKLYYYSLLVKMMNIIRVEITYDYSTSIPIEYICPSCIKDIFPSLERLYLTVNTNIKKTELLLNPNSDEYIMEYINVKNMNLNKIYYPEYIINAYNEKRQKNELPKLYKYIINEAIYTNDYSQVEINNTEDEYISKGIVQIEYDDKTNDKTFSIHEVSSEYGISQLLLLPSYLYYSCLFYPMFFMKLLDEGFFDSSTVLGVYGISLLKNQIDLNLLNQIMTTHVFPNVTELIYDDYVETIIVDLDTENFESVFPVNIISIIDTIHIHSINLNQEEEMASLLDDLAYTYSIHIDTIDMIVSSSSQDIKKLDYIENNKQYINCLDIEFNNIYQDEIDKRNSLERFLKSDVLLYLNELTVSFHKNISIEYLTWISTLFNDNKFNTIHKLKINLYSMKKYSSSEYLTWYENIMEILIPKASSVKITYCTMSFINQLIPKGFFYNTIELFLRISDITDDNFLKLYTTDNFPQLKKIQLDSKDDNKWWISFIKSLCTYMNNNYFPSSSIVHLGECDFDYYDDYIYDPNTSIFRYKYDNNSIIDSIIGRENETMNKYEIETLFECINQNKTQNIKSLNLYIYDDEQLSKLINFITTGRFPKLKNISFHYSKIYIKSDIYEQQLKDSTFIQENHVDYKFIKEKIHSSI
ncbi:hypothetical protein WA158_004025 [Blastocystis sp. Blastoise]